MGLSLSFEPPPADYPNHLAAPRPERRRLPSARRLLLALVVLSAIPRAMLALHIPCIAGDGVHYVNAAQALEANDFQEALWEGGVNVYPIILVVLHRIGLDWEVGAAVWGVAISSLVVLPLWGWVRRQFDDRVALAACLLYIVHPKFISESPELMRDPTFWFFFTLAIYGLWRAVTEVRYRYFIMAGAAITLASLTRIEGLFLLIPLFCWTFWRWLALETGRWRLLAGAALCVAAFPLLLILVNVVWLSGHSDWAMIRISPLARIQPWLESMFRGATPPEGDGTTSPPEVGLILWRFFPTMTRGLSPVFALLMLGGMWGWRRTWARRDNQTLFYTAVVILIGIWIQAWSNWYLKGNINARYALPIVLMASPFAALGLLAIVARAARIVDRLGWQAGARRVAIGVVAALVVIPSIAAVLHTNLTNYDRRLVAGEVGRWLLQESPDPPAVVGPWDAILPISYYSGSRSYCSYRYDDSDASILKLVEEHKADVVFLQSLGPLTSARCESLMDRLEQLGFEPVDPEVLPETDGGYHVLVRGRDIESP